MNKVQGRIIRGVGGFYYVHDAMNRIFECRAKGIFRNKKQKPLVGDQVVIDIIDLEERTGNLVEIIARKSELYRPAAANVDQAIVVFAAKNPDPNYILLDKFLITMNRMELPVTLCFNKTDLVSEEEQTRLKRIYAGACDVHFISVNQGDGMEALKEILRGRISVLAGPSGVGKSSFLNYFCEKAAMETGSVSEKIGRGRHTTRHAELFYVDLGDEASAPSYLMDTPGFSSMELQELDYRELRFCYPEFDAYEGTCRFQGCVHVAEPDCQVKQALETGEIARERYESYRYIYEELRKIKKY